MHITTLKVHSLTCSPGLSESIWTMVDQLKTGKAGRKKSNCLYQKKKKNSLKKKYIWSIYDSSVIKVKVFYAFHLSGNEKKIIYQDSVSGSDLEFSWNLFKFYCLIKKNLASYPKIEHWGEVHRKYWGNKDYTEAKRDLVIVQVDVLVL